MVDTARYLVWRIEMTLYKLRWEQTPLSPLYRWLRGLDSEGWDLDMWRQAQHKGFADMHREMDSF